MVLVLVCCLPNVTTSAPCRCALKVAIYTVMYEVDIFVSSTGNFNNFGPQCVRWKHRTLGQRDRLWWLRGLEGMRVDNIEPRCVRAGFRPARTMSSSDWKVSKLHLPALCAELRGVKVEGSFAQCKSSSYMFYCEFWCPLRLQPGVHCLWRVRRSIIRFLLCCWRALRLQCAATERDCLRVGTTVVEL